MSIKTIWAEKIWPWMKKWWVVAWNVVAIVLTYGMIFDKGVTGAEVLLGLTIMLNVAYYGYKLFMGKSKI